MKNLLLATLAIALAVPALAQTMQRAPLHVRPGMAANQPAGQAPGTSFEADCVDISMINGNSDFDFVCRKKDGSSVHVITARNYHMTGNYYVGHDSATGAGIGDTQTLVGVSQAVTAFMLLKEIKPSSAAVLHISGVYSKLSMSNGKPVVSSAQFYIP